MKNLLFLPLLFLVFHTTAQNTYAEAIQQGDRALRQGQYKTAINKYFSAEAFDPSKKDVVRRKVNVVFDRIEALKKEAETALVATEKAEMETRLALGKANKLVDAFYFYEDRFALAYGEKVSKKVFYFIDKNGDEVEKLGRWGKAEQFDERGYAQVTPMVVDTVMTFDPITFEEEQNFVKTDIVSDEIYFLDTFGRVYLIAYDIEDLNEGITALDLSEKELEEIPLVVFEQKQLEILLLNSNKLTSLPVEIGQLEQLISLDLDYNDLMSLPAEIGQLEQLMSLGFSGNNLTVLPVGIGKLEQLRSLDLDYNNLKVLPAEIGKLEQLTSLHLRHNDLASLPVEIGQLEQLTFLDLTTNNLIELPKEIGQLEQLTSLYLSDNDLTSLPIEIENLQNLLYLNLRSNPISTEEQKRIHQLLPNCHIFFSNWTQK